jgi:hypothetical protein
VTDVHLFLLGFKLESHGFTPQMALAVEKKFFRVFSSNYLESGRWKKSENPVILCVIHHRQNPIESNCMTGLRRYFHINISL